MATRFRTPRAQRQLTSPMSRAGMATADQSAIDTSPTTFPHTRPQTRLVPHREPWRTVKLKMIATIITSILNQKSGA